MNQSRFKQDAEVYKKLTHPEKYCGKEKIIITRSSWEKHFIFSFLDSNPCIIEWSSEDIIIPYRYEVDNRKHRYYPDFYAKIKDNNGNIKKIIFEIKPKKDLIKPINTKRKTKSYYYQCQVYIKNKNKFTYARKYCKMLTEQTGIETTFQILTEFELGLVKNKNKNF